jgi:hypothetical protein
MAKKARQRKLLGKDTVFYWNDERWTEEQLAQKNGKAWQDQGGDCTFAPWCSNKEPLLMLSRSIGYMWPHS